MPKIEQLEATLIGIGKLIKSSVLDVPPYQRPYSWSDKQVDELYKDISDALLSKNDEYFLGTVVTTRNEDGKLTIIDGQQRLVTASVLIASIRDYFMRDGQTERARDIEREYLFKREIRSRDSTPLIQLTAEDRAFYTEAVATIPAPPATRSVTPGNPAQQRLAVAVERAQQFVTGIVATTKEPDDRLIDILDFLTEKAKLVSVSVSTESSAFIIFEVLNDRGLDLSVTDLLKNYIFRTAADRVDEAQVAWLQMTTIITDVAAEPELKVFVRHYWSSRFGTTRERDLYEAIRKQVRNKTQAVELAKSLAKAAVFYASLSNPASDTWDDYDAAVRESVEVLDQLGVSQLRPLLIAVFTHFTAAEVTKALPMMVGWTVRFLICGSGGSGTLETAYAERAKEVSAGTVKTAAQLYAAMKDTVPDDKTFEARFASATVSNPSLAKYYLRVIERQKQAKEDELIVNPSDTVNLEHVLPKTPGPDWSHIPPADQKALLKRIGNLTLLHSKRNARIGNASFDKKKEVFKESAVQITKDICTYPTWDEAAISARQLELAKVAVKAWRAKPHA